MPIPPPLGPGGLPIVEIDLRGIVIPQLAGVKWWDSYPVCQIDVMVAYTSEAKAVSAADIDNDINAAFTSAQTALDDSGINFKLNRVGEDEVKAFFQSPGFHFDYHDDGTIENDLSTLTSGSDPTGTIAKIHDIRDSVGADLRACGLIQGSMVRLAAHRAAKPISWERLRRRLRNQLSRWCLGEGVVSTTGVLCMNWPIIWVRTMIEPGRSLRQIREVVRLYQRCQWTTL